MPNKETNKFMNAANGGLDFMRTHPVYPKEMFAATDVADDLGRDTRFITGDERHTVRAAEHICWAKIEKNRVGGMDVTEKGAYILRPLKIGSLAGAQPDYFKTYYLPWNAGG